MNSFLLSNRFSGRYCGSYGIICETPKRSLKIQVFDKKAILLMKKCIGQFFSFSIEYDQPQGTIFFGSTRYLETYCAKDKIVFFLGSKRPINKFFKTKRYLPEEKMAIFFSFNPL